MQTAPHSDLRADSPAGMLEALADAKRFNQWMADTVAPFIGTDVLELGAGIGNLTALLSSGRRRYVAADINPEYLAHLKTLLQNRPNLSIALCDVSNPRDLEQFRGQMDTVICLNVLEHINDDVGALRNMRSCLKAGGRALILVPQGMRAFGSLDEILEHIRRYSRSELETKMIAAGFRIERLLTFNRATYPAWFLNSRLLRTKKLSRTQLRAFDFLVPLWRRIDHLLVWPPTSLIGIGVRNDR